MTIPSYVGHKSGFYNPNPMTPEERAAKIKDCKERNRLKNKQSRECAKYWCIIVEDTPTPEQCGFTRDIVKWM